MNGYSVLGLLKKKKKKGKNLSRIEIRFEADGMAVGWGVSVPR